MSGPTERLRAERDLYRRLLELDAASSPGPDGQTDPRPLLEGALRLLMEATGARQGYLALYGGAPLESEPGFSLAHDCSEDDVAELRGRISKGIVRRALEEGQTVSTAAAIDDPRFMSLPSVTLRGIRAVMCAPIGSSRLGVLYLQGRSEPGPWGEEDRALTERVAHEVAPFAERLLRAPASDPTARERASLRGLERIAGRSRALARLFGQLGLLAPLDVTVLIRGPSGSGKTLLARALHDNGPRASGPFVELNCAALPETLLESELFGAEKGAHSTADRATPGKVAAAEGGTLFLDEIGELPLASQAKLLTFLQSRTYFRLGASEASHADVRIVVASHVDLEAAVRERRFREDLLYRIAVVPLDVPPLSARLEDIEPIADAVIAGASDRHGMPRLALAPSALATLVASEWPGQVRQLANAVEAGLIRAVGSGATRIERHHLSGADPDATGEATTFHDATRAFQRGLVERTLREVDWNVSRAAERLDLSRSRLNELIRAFALSRPG
ncbi:MAG: sigma 54-interacting transcriptional regulator [Sandaracinaceae bacterium]